MATNGPADALRQSGFESPNLDGLSTDPRELREAAHVLGLMAAYADHKARAMELRQAGDIDAAQASESAADVQYERLPQWARW